MTLKKLLEWIEHEIGLLIKRKSTCKIIYEINLSQGGIGECKVTGENKIK